MPETGTFRYHDDEDERENDDEEGELTVDVYEKDSAIVIQTMIAGVKPEDLTVNITREVVTIRGKREQPEKIPHHDYFEQELYWGAFARTIVLPAEIDTEEAEAIERHGLLTIRLPKIDKNKTSKLKIRSI
jgi:HSP20 family protein